MPKRLIITCAKVDINRQRQVIDLDTLEPLFKLKPEIVYLCSEYIIPDNSFPIEIGYHILDIAIEELLQENNFEQAFKLLSVNSYYMINFYDFWFGESRAGIIRKYSRLSKTFQQLDRIQDIMFSEALLENFNLNLSNICIEMETVIKKINAPWYFDRQPGVSNLECHGQLITYVDTNPGLNYTLIVQMGDYRVNKCLIGGETFRQTKSCGGIIRADLCRFPYIVFQPMSFQTGRLKDLDAILTSPQWMGFFRLLTLGWGEHAAVFLAYSGVHGQTLLKEFNLLGNPPEYGGSQRLI